MLPDTDGADLPTFSPDGQWIAFSTRDGKLKRVPTSGGSVETLCDCDVAYGLDWGADDSIVIQAGTRYGLTAGPDGVEFITIRTGEASTG